MPYIVEVIKPQQLTFLVELSRLSWSGLEKIHNINFNNCRSSSNVLTAQEILLCMKKYIADKAQKMEQNRKNHVRDFSLSLCINCNKNSIKSRPFILNYKRVQNYRNIWNIDGAFDTSAILTFKKCHVWHLKHSTCHK